MDDPSDFSDLQQQAMQLTADMDTGTDLPRVERNLNQILEAGQRLLAKVGPISQDNTDVKASILLGSKGYDVPKISQKLEGLSAAKTFEPLEPVRDTDIQGFLKNERENALLAVIEQTRQNTLAETERRHWECMENEWEREKQKILNALLGSGQDTIDFQPETESFLIDSVSLQGRSALDNMEMAYSRQVYEYNEQVINSAYVKPSLVDMFLQVANTSDNKHVEDLWEMVKAMVDIPSCTGRQNAQTQKAFVRNARAHLEQSYKKFITGQISGNLQQAQLGGIPGTCNLVRSYLNIRQATLPRGLEDGTVEGHPTWAMIFYCLRCGDLKAAQSVVTKAGHQLGDFPTFLQEYLTNPGHRLSPSSETKIQLQYRRVVKQCPDPFKRAVFCIIGQCDYQEDHTDIADKIDDYLWLKLCQIQADGEDKADTLTLQKLQTMLYEDYGESHFNGYQQPFLYFQVLLLTAQFEAAIEFMSRIERLRCHAVHVAIVLYSLNLLQCSQNTQAQLLSKDPGDPIPQRRLNFARLIMMYTRKFEETDPREALQYFYFLRELRTSQNENLFMTCVSELVQETKEYEMLLGQLLKDGSRKPGAIDKFQVETQRIIEKVANDTENKGSFEDAVKLYDLAKKPEKVLELLNKLLSQVVSQTPSNQSSRDRLKNLAVGVAERYRSGGVAESVRSSSNSFYLILDLVTFFDLYHSGQMEDALEIIRQLHLLPLTTDAVEHKVNTFRNYTEEVRRCLPDVLLATMNVLHHQFKAARNTAPQSPLVRGRNEDGGKETYLNYLRSQAKALIMFAGMLPYRLPGDTYTRLVQVEVLMN
ncbi:nuclear pore complex protein Nup93-like [Mya arenaria]|uniref:nuclear pore complex protein Nup93-like n=1 Tax=Mya arenaria TaxID=6604 RepID=UPI0022E52C8D|nr:nuclear pore complex protein Nup93-like [Mya arenaria]XP_052817035.1 nuclear pore complex protein Nup93-like [Mya arenaria]XP_052817036.1 nuclear pore complex protein Nup93-like [Mya arenaria]XP_052817037.1 nuclear pore complex protein Nup93-like [Mya arenaria]XP_052817040.1 nuclear pore complex protein Nup93-like [Mya arenaria]